MSDHDGHTINVGPVTVGETLAKAAPHPCTCRMCGAARDRMALVDENDRLRAENTEYHQMQKAFKAHMRAVEQVAAPLAKDDGEGGKWHGGRSALLVLKDAVADNDRLRAENTALAAALGDIAGMSPTYGKGTVAWVASAECSNMGTRCCWEYLGKPDGGPEEWCPVCVAEVAWSAWKLGGLG